MNCFICLEIVTKTEKINCTTCLCKNSIGHIHDSCLQTYAIKCKDISNCPVCKSKYTFSRNFEVNKLIRDNVNPNVIVRDNLNRIITDEDILIGKRETRTSNIYLIMYISLIVAIGFYCFSLNNFYADSCGIFCIILIKATLSKSNFCLNIILTTQVLLIKLIELATLDSAKYAVLTRTMSILLFVVSMMIFSFLINNIINV